MTPAGGLTAVPSTTFAGQGVLERADLQRALREHIDVLDDGLLVVAEEFGDFVDARRRVDLLCVDRAGQLVVVELKRTEDGGHMELQALRYAAMVSTMTFEQLADIYARHLARTGPTSEPGLAGSGAGVARARLGEWLEDVGGENAVLERRVRIVLAAAGFDPQITTAVLWLNDVYGLDIRCVRLTPYRVEERLLLDVQQVIPLPEAEELTIKLRQRESAAQAASASAGGADWTPYVITTPDGETKPLRKRRAVLHLTRALHAAGVPGEKLATVLPGARFLSVPGVLTGEDLQEAFLAAYPKAQGNLG